MLDTGDKIGKPGKQDNKVQVIRITENQDTDDRLQRAVHRMPNGKDSKIMAKATPNLFYNCREPSTNQLFLCKTKPIRRALPGNPKH